MNSLPGWVASAFDLSALDRMAATAAPPIRNETGRTITSTKTMMTTPTTSTFLPHVRPCLDFDERTDREFGDGDRRARRTMITERLDVDLVHERVVAHVDQEDGGLRDMRHRRAVGFEVTAQVGQRLS